MAPTVLTRDQLGHLVAQLAVRPEKSILTIDGYPAAGKTTLAMVLARQPGVAWAPLDRFRLGDGFDYRRIERDVLKPFRKKGLAREVRRSRPGARGFDMELAGRKIPGQRVMIFEGFEATKAARGLGANYVLWVDCVRQARLDRLRTKAATSTEAIVGVDDWVDRAEESGLREQVLSVAHYVVETSPTTIPGILPRLGSDR